MNNALTLFSFGFTSLPDCPHYHHKHLQICCKIHSFQLTNQVRRLLAGGATLFLPHHFQYERPHELECYSVLPCLFVVIVALIVECPLYFHLRYHCYCRRIHADSIKPVLSRAGMFGRKNKGALSPLSICSYH